MSVIDRLVRANEAYAAAFRGAPPQRPRLPLAIVTCMDCRLDLFGGLGLCVGDAHIIRNAGGLPTDDVLRSLALSQRVLGTREVMLIQHTDCGMEGLDDHEFRRELAAETGEEPAWDVPGFPDVTTGLRRSLAVLRNCRWIPHREDIRGFIWDVATARLTEVCD